MQWNHPDRTDHYIMENTRHIRAFMLAFSSGKEKLDHDDFILTFGPSGKQKEAWDASMNPRERLAVKKVHWMMAVGARPADIKAAVEETLGASIEELQQARSTRSTTLPPEDSLRLRE